MKKSLEKATQGLIFARNELKEARKEANDIEYSVLLPLIGRVNDLLLDLEKFELGRNTGGKLNMPVNAANKGKTLC